MALASKTRSLRELLLGHELIFIALIILAVAGNGYSMYLWNKSTKESQRIHSLIQEIQQTRGDLYRQMKELFDAFFLDDANAKNEYELYTQTVLTHFEQLKTLAIDDEEYQAIDTLEKNYRSLVNEAPALFYRYEANPNDLTKKLLYDDIETDIFNRYDEISQRTEALLKLKQNNLKIQLDNAKKTSSIILAVSFVLACLLWVISRSFMKRAIVNPINAIMQATTEISAGNLHHKVPESGAAELATLSQEINKMAVDLQTSRDALVRTEKQAAMGLLVPMLAHNIRNPLASIRATAQLLDEPDQSADTRESMHGIIQSVDSLERWTSALLAYLLPIKPQLQSAQLEEIIQGGLMPVERKALEKGIEIISNAGNLNFKIITDAHLLEQVIYNLVLNAVDASPKGSKIQISARLEQSLLSIEIQDEGSGMPFTPDPHAVSPGPSTKRFGTGLGIPFAYKVCEVLNGDITFNTSEPQGTKIIINLPQPQ